MSELITLLVLSGSLLFFYLSWIEFFNKENIKQDVNKLKVMSIFSLLITIFLSITIYFYKTTEPTELICRFSNNCTIAVYSWSVTLLSFSITVYFFILFIKWIKKLN